MATAQRHYEQLLAPIYVWMAGGVEAAFAAGTQDVAPLVPGRGLAIDLGAGFGMHAIPLARAGYGVLALDTSRELLDVLRANAAELPVRCVEGDLLDFRKHAGAPLALIVCMGDTLTHLPSTDDVERLARDVAACLAPGGRFVATFRDYTRTATGDARFIPVRSDANRIHTCFLEEHPDHMQVHDIVHERDGAAWKMRVSSYPKLRLAPAAVAETLRYAGLETTMAPGARGMVRITAVKP
ncbi:MAG TPA: class I SAM-dependent methyltransferase [Gammaproteobacteria bacterium]|nr:class I SAM-dependent methyltransferase [Gammaproteobacteria bacterium]